MKQIHLALTFVLLSSIAGAEETTNLKKLLAHQKANPSGSLKTARLERDWVGNILDESGNKTVKLRLEHGGIRKGTLRLFRLVGGRYVGSDAPAYRENLPSLKELRSMKTLAELEKKLGKPRPAISGWQDGERSHWSAGWTLFTVAPDDRLRYLSVFALVSRIDQDDDKKHPVDIDKLQLSHGYLRPANPGSEEELKAYPTGEALFRLKEDEKKKEREKYPLPLRKLVEVSDRPDDSNLVHYRAHLNSIRENPDPKLFQQLIAEIHEGTVRMRRHFEAILVDGWHGLKPWKPKQRAIAIKACIDGISIAKTDLAMQDVVITLLKMKGGGVIEIGDRDGERGTRLKVKNGGYSSRGIRNPPSLKETQAKLRAMLLEDGK